MVYHQLPHHIFSLRNLAFLAACLALVGCSKGRNSLPTQQVRACRGIYYTQDLQGDLLKWNEFKPVNSYTCLTDNLPLSNWERSSQKFVKHQVQCVPQPQFASQTLLSSNNYYGYRDGKVWLDLNSSTGIYRRLILGEANDGSPIFSRSEGCFYQRTGEGTDAAYGSQLLLDVTVRQWASTETTSAMEIFRYTVNGDRVAMVRFDNVSDWTAYFCPYLSVPTTYCKNGILDNGNIFYFPTLTSDQEADLLRQAVVIRTDYNYSLALKSDFESLWEAIDETATETETGAFKYGVIFSADVPPLIDQAWRAYLKGARAHMPPNTGGLGLQP